MLTLSQEHYIEELAEKFNIINSKLYRTPMEINLSLEQVEKINCDVPYRPLIGALLYISSGTRPDISYAVNYLSRFCNSYSETHFKYALRILKYLYLTKHLQLIYFKDERAPPINCYVDADWAGDKIDRKSTTGFIIQVFGNIVVWKTKKQNSVAKSSTFAEYIALSESVTEVLLIKSILNFMLKSNILKIKIENPIEIKEDNSGAIQIAQKGNLTKNSKHIEVHFHYVNDNYLKGNIDVVKIKSDHNIADICTKALGKLKFEKFRDALNLMPKPLSAGKSYALKKLTHNSSLSICQSWNNTVF